MNDRLLWILCISLLAACSKTEDEQMHEYLEFYYPSSGSYTYEIMFDWGMYRVTTGPGVDEELHPDSEPYRGYITMRPHEKESGGNVRPTYVITPEGEVWTYGGSDIPAERTRDEVVTEQTEYGTSTQTTTLTSALEPVVEHFRMHQNEWTHYGVLESEGAGYRLRKVGR